MSHADLVLHVASGLEIDPTQGSTGVDIRWYPDGAIAARMNANVGGKPSSQSCNTPVCAMVPWLAILCCVCLNIVVILVVKILGGGGTSSKLW